MFTWMMAVTLILKQQAHHQNQSRPPSTRPDIPDVAAKSTRRKRLPGSDVYGVTTNDFPFLAMSDELNVSGLGGGIGRGRSGRIQQNRGR